MVDFITFGVLLGAEGYHRGSFWGLLVPLDLHLGVFGWPLAFILGSQGGTPGRFQRAVASKRGGLSYARTILNDFGAQRVSRRPPKWS